MSLLDLLLDDLPFNETELRQLIITSPRRYKTHFIEKRHGRGQREISQPTAELKLLQRWVLSNIVSKLPVHQAAMAYRSGTSIADHARLHVRNNFLLKIDFKDFFPSILGTDFVRHMRRYMPEFDHNEVELLARILFKYDPRTKRLRLSIGAPSSPAVSNTILFDFDSLLESECHKIKVTYSRYADDLALSSNEPKVLDEAMQMVKNAYKVIRYPSLQINDEKTVFTSRKHHRQLTGLVLTPDKKLSVGRDRKRLIRAMVYRFAEGKLQDTDEIETLRGLIAFIVSIEPNYLSTLVRMAGEDTIFKLTHRLD